MASTFLALKPSLRSMAGAEDERRCLTRGFSMLLESFRIFATSELLNLNSLIAFWLSGVMPARGMLRS